MKLFLDGPKLAAWIRAQAPHLEGHEQAILGPTTARTMRRWRAGHCAWYSKADTVCVRLGLSLSDVPDDFWLDKKRRLDDGT